MTTCRVAGFLLIVGVVLLLGVCGCKSEEPTGPEEFSPPSNLRAIAKSGAVVAKWDKSPSEALEDFGWYTVYCCSEPSNPDDDSTVIVVKKDYIPKDSTQTTIGDLTNGRKYYFYARCFKNDGATKSPLVGPAETAPRPEGEDTIYEFASTNPSGFSFQLGDPLPFKWENKDWVDLWLDGRGNTPLELASPSTYDTQDWRVTKLKDVGEHPFDDVIETTDSGWSQTDKVEATQGHIYIYKTQEGNFGKIRVESIGGIPPDRNITFRWAYQTIPDYRHF